MKMRATIQTFTVFLLLFSGISFSQQNADSEVGRYQIFFSTLARADVYLVDTKTGKVWINIQYTDVEGQPRIWVNQERIDSKEDLVRWIKEQKLSKSGN